MRVFGLADRTDPITEIIARKIIDVAQTGERDPLRIRARAIAVGVARELMFNSQGMLDRDWSRRRMSVNDDEGKELFSFRMVDFATDSSGK